MDKVLDKQTQSNRWPDSATAPTQDGVVAEGTTPQESRVIVRTTRIGRFSLLREIGSGGMGTVFAAYDEQLDRKVALKILRKPRAGSERQRNQILREARAAARVAHPCVVSVYEVSEADGLIHIAMEFVEGETLHAWQSKGAHHWRQILSMYIQVGQALQAAHEVDVVHRDFKPENVLIGEDERPRVVDFGLARVGVDEHSPAADSAEHAALRAQGRITLSGVVAGTLGYMSPEQLRGGNVDARSDQWSFCASLFEALYGFLPYSGKTLADYSESLSGRPRAQPRERAVPEEVHSALLRGLSTDPAARFPTMDSLLAALSQEHSDDVASGTDLRKLFARSAIVITVLVFVGMQLRLWNHQPTHLEPIIASLVLLSANLIGGLSFWRTIKNQSIHRTVWLLMTTTLGQNFLLRVLGWMSDVSRVQMVPFELAVITGAILFGTLALLRRGMWIALIPLSTAFLIERGWIPTRIGVLAYLLCVTLFFVVWQRAAADITEQRAVRRRSSSRMMKLYRSGTSSDRSSQPSRKDR